MKVKFPRGVEIDINNIPENFEEIIKESFKGYTEGTAKAYTYQDKLAYIDRCRELLHGDKDPDDAVYDLIKETFADRLDEYGEFTSESEFLSTEFMEDCYRLGNMDLYCRYTGNRHVDDKIMKLLERAIRVVINYDGE